MTDKHEHFTGEEEIENSAGPRDRDPDESRFGFQRPQYYVTVPSKVNDLPADNTTLLHSVWEYSKALEQLKMWDLAILGYKFSDSDIKEFEELDLRVKKFEKDNNIKR